MKTKIKIGNVDTPTKNGNVYTKEVWEKSIKEYKEKFIDTRLSMITKEMPQETVTNILNTIGLVDDLEIEGDNIMASATFFHNTPDGLMIETAIEDGLLTIRPTGMGTTKKDKNGNNVVQDDYQINGFFVTPDPA